MSRKFDTPTDELMRDAKNLTMNMMLREGQRNAEDQIGIAQVYAILAVANELKRANDLRVFEDYGVTGEEDTP